MFDDSNYVCIAGEGSVLLREVLLLLGAEWLPYTRADVGGSYLLPASRAAAYSKMAAVVLAELEGFVQMPVAGLPQPYYISATSRRLMREENGHYV